MRLRRSGISCPLEGYCQVVVSVRASWVVYQCRIIMVYAFVEALAIDEHIPQPDVGVPIPLGYCEIPGVKRKPIFPKTGLCPGKDGAGEDRDRRSHQLALSPRIDSPEKFRSSPNHHNDHSDNRQIGIAVRV